MRQIKFRGRSLNTGAWVYGDIQHKGKRAFVEYEVAPETVGQFTGLMDKNGDEIYEGDIIGSSDGNIRHVVRCNTKTLDLRAEFIPYCLEKPTCGIDQEWINECSKSIIGNVYDNPSLLK